MALTVTVVRSVDPTEDTLWDIATLRALGVPTISISGTLGTAEIAALAVSAAKLLPGAVYHATTAGSGSAYTLAVPVGTLENGAYVRCRLHANCEYDPTLNVNSLGAKKLRRNFDQVVEAAEFKTGQELVLSYDANGNGGSGAWQIVSVVGHGRTEGLSGPNDHVFVYRDTATACTVQASELGEVVLRDLNGRMLLKRRSFTLAVDITVSGAGGRDNFAEAPSTWYYIWLIYKPSTQTYNTLLSTSPYLENITLPTDYSYAGLVGQVYNDSGSNFRDFEARGRHVWFAEQVLFTNLFHADGSTFTYISTTAGKTVELSTLVPPIARVASGVVGSNVAGTAYADASSRVFVRLARDTDGMGAWQFSGVAMPAPTTNNFSVCCPFEVPLNGQDFAWVGGSSVRVRMVVSGYSW